MLFINGFSLAFFTLVFVNIFVNSEVLDDEIRERLLHLESKLSVIDQLERENNALKKGMSSIKKEMMTMKAKFDESIGEMKTKVRQQDIALSELKQACICNKEVPGKNQSLKKAYTLSTSKEKNMNSKTLRHSREMEKLESDDKPEVNHDTNGNIFLNKRLLAPKAPISNASTVVAFAAHMTHAIDNGAVGHIIPFEQVNINEGNGYNGNDGVFICPKTGLYLFTFNIHLENVNQHAGVVLKINGQSYMYTYEITTGTVSKANAGDTSVFHLHAGDHVWLAIYNSGSHVYGGPHSNFAGVLLVEY